MFFVVHIIGPCKWRMQQIDSTAGQSHLELFKTIISDALRVDYLMHVSYFFFTRRKYFCHIFFSICTLRDTCEGAFTSMPHFHRLFCLIGLILVRTQNRKIQF